MLNSNQKGKTYIQLVVESIFTIFKTILFPKKNSLKFLRAYLLMIIGGTILLSTPWALQSTVKSNGANYTMIDALFTAASAFSDTGLTITTTASQFTIFGKIVIMALIVIGGVGIMAIKIMLLWLFGKTLGLKEFIMFNDERGSTKIGDSADVIYLALKTGFWVILFGTMALTPYFYFKPQPELMLLHKNFGQSLWYALFHTVSALNNAGFDIIGSNSFALFGNDIWVQLVIIILLVIGGIGFPVLFDISRYIEHKRQRSPHIFKWSLFTKITTTAYFFIFLTGLLLSLWFEISSNDQNSLWRLANNSESISSAVSYTRFEVINSIIFTTFSTRNAGFSIIPISQFQESTKTLWSIMMWIGSSPASTAGGIRTTTFAIAILAIFYSFNKKSNRVFVFRHRIPAKTVFQALIVLVSSIGLLCVATTIIILDTHITRPDLIQSPLYTLNNIIFEVTSAFGTTGLSAGITSLLGTTSLLVIIILMIVGQMGITLLFSVLATDANNIVNSDKTIYGEEDVLIS